YIASGKIDSSRLFESQVDVGFVRGDQRADHIGHIPTRKIVRFKFTGSDGKSGLCSRNKRVDDDAGGDLSDPHPDEFADRDAYVGKHGCDPEPDRYEVKENEQANDAQKNK